MSKATSGTRMVERVMSMQLKLLGNIAVVVLVLAGCPTVLAGVITISVIPSSQTVLLGSPVNVAVRIQGLGEPPSLGTFDLNLGFNTAILSLNNITFGDPILGDQLDPTGGGNTFNFITPGVGTVELFELSLASAADLNALQAPSFILASIILNSVGIGSSPLTLSINALGDENGSSLSASLQNASVNVNATSGVPEPATFTLGALGLLAGFLLRHWFQSSCSKPNDLLKHRARRL